MRLLVVVWVAATLLQPAIQSKAVYYRPGVMKERAQVNGVWGESPDACYMSTPLSNDIGSVWEVRTVWTAKRGHKHTSLRCVQADVSQPRHRKWQIADNRLFESDPGSTRRLCGFLGRPDECIVSIRRLK